VKIEKWFKRVWESIRKFAIKKSHDIYEEVFMPLPDAAAVKKEMDRW
jgi:hypothetical protein